MMTFHISLFLFPGCFFFESDNVLTCFHPPGDLEKRNKIHVFVNLLDMYLGESS